MKRVRLSIQIALSLALLSVTVWFAAQALGLAPDERRAALAARIGLCENLAVTTSVLTNHKQWEGIALALTELQARSPDVVSAGLRRLDGRLLAQAGNHEQSWHDTLDRRSTETQIYVPILLGKERWGALEVAFQPLGARGWPSWLDPSQWRLIVFIAAANALIYVFYLGRVLYELDPGRVMPQRVRSAFDALTEGLLVLDRAGRIVLANQALASAVGRAPDDLLGTPAAALPFRETGAAGPRPWEQVCQDPSARSGVEMSLAGDAPAPRTFFVNAAPIADQRGQVCGVLASFADITQLEEKKQELLAMLDTVRESRDKIRQQNDELSYLATRDPLTGCLNRRSFFEQFELRWRQGDLGELSCLMVDIDKFKSINDRYGHATGDEVLRRVAGTLLEAVGAAGLVGRYGGEEFSIVLPCCSFDHAAEIAELLRQRVAALPFPQLTVTASFGLSSGALGAASCQELLDQADRSLYYSKHAGRDRVTRFDRVPPDFQIQQREARPAAARVELAAGHAPVPYHAVACLLRALAFRDPETACHSARVADLAVATARGLMSAADAYLLEIAALLHDIGKIGVPDSILLKPGPLTAEEWNIMNLHAGIGVEIVNSSFGNPALVDIVRCHHAFFGGADPGLPRGAQIPLGARIVSICDAYDAMVSNRIYRKGRTPEAAFAELRRMAGAQFDPELVERFIDVVTHRPPAPSPASVPVSQDLALHLGLHTERLAGALDELNFEALQAVALHLKTTAEAHGLTPLAEAAELLQTGAGEKDLEQLVDVIHEIMSISLSAQQVHLAINHDMAQVALARGQFIAAKNNSPTLAMQV